MPTDQDPTSAGAADPLVAPRALRDAMGRLPTGVCVVSAVADGHDVGLTVGSVVSVSLEPPLVLVSIGRSVRLHDALTGAGEWGVSVLAEDDVAVSSVFARSGGELLGRFETVPHHRGSVADVPLLDHACAWLECRTSSVHEAGDHTIVVGRVVASRQPDEVVPPLVHHAGGYAGVHHPAGD